MVAIVVGRLLEEKVIYVYIMLLYPALVGPRMEGFQILHIQKSIHCGISNG